MTQSDGGSSGSSGGRGGGGVSEGVALKKGPWTAAEDQILIDYVHNHGEGNWNSVQKYSGLNRCGKSCRLRWANHLRPNLKKGSFTPEEERLILELHARYGNKWARMAAQLPGRTDNEIKNYWNTRVKRRKRQGLPLYPSDVKQSYPTTPTNSIHSISPSPTTPSTSSTFSFQSNQSPIPFSPTPPPHSPLSSPIQSNPIFDHNSSFSFPSNPTFTFHRPAPLLGTPFRFKRYRDSPGFSLPISPTPQTNLLGQNSVPSQLPEMGSYRFPASFNSTLPITIGTQFESNQMGLSGSVKSELPSSQFPQIQSEIMWDSKLNLPSTQRNGGLLEDILDNLLEDAQKSADGSREVMPKEEAKDQMNSLPDDLSKLLNLPTYQVQDWYDSGSGGGGGGVGSGGEIPNGHESLGLTDHDHFSMDMHHVASLFPVASSADCGQTPGNWDSLPGICKGW